MSLHRLLWLLRILALTASFYGYLQYTRKKIKLEFALAVIFSGIGLVMFFAGILDIMQECAWFILSLGLILAVYSLYKRESVKNVISIGTVFFAIGALVLAVVLLGDKLEHSDNFSHWATVLKIMIQNDRFPISGEQVFFPSYPLGSSAFIYYIVKITDSTAEWMQMYAQAILMLGMLTCLFAFSNKLCGALLSAAVALMLLVSNTALYDLLVDTLIPLVALAAFSICVYYRDALTGKGWAVAIVNAFLIVIKNSGALFVFIVAVYYLVKTLKRPIRRQSLLAVAAQILSPVLTLLLWQRHVKLTFQNGLLAQHSMSIQHFENVFNGKTAQDIQSIAQGMIDKTFSLSNTVIYLILLCTAMIIAHRLLKLEREREPWLGRELLIVAAMSYVLYQIGLFGMYLFSMESGEATSLAAYDRYYQTILIFLVGIITIAALSLMDELDFGEHTGAFNVATIAACIVLSLFALNPDFGLYKKQELTTWRIKHDELITEQNVYENSCYIIAITTPEGVDYNFIDYMSIYMLLPENLVIIQNDEDLEWLKENWENYQYLILLEPTAGVAQWANEKFGMSYGTIKVW